MENEKQFQAWVRLHAQSKYQSLMMRNNSGALKNPHTGVPVRFGLGNDSKQTNTVFKSSDLIGITPITCPCGHTYGVFTALEIKKPGWTPNKKNQEYIAQNNFITTIQQKFGISGFIQSEGDFHNVYRWEKCSYVKRKKRAIDF